MTPVPARHLVAVGLSVAAVRWIVSRDREVFHVTPDEPGQLAMARFLAGGTRWNLFDHSTWRPAFAALIAPIHWVTDDPTLGFQLAIGVNAVLGGLAAVLLCVLVRRLSTLSGGWCAAAAVLASVLPGVLFPTAWVWAESLVALTVIATTLLLARFVDAPAVGRALAAGAMAGAGFAVHGRLFPLAVTASAIGVTLAARRRCPWVVAAWVVAAAALSGLVAQLWSGWVVDRVWQDPTTTNSAGGLLDRLGRPGEVAVAAIGQTWYLLASTACVAGIGTIGLVHLARRGRSDAAVLLATVLPLIAVSVVFVADRTRPDHLVYGRYNDAVIGPVLVTGVAMLLGSGTVSLLRRAGIASIVTLVATGGLLLVLRGDELDSGAGVRAMVVGIQWFGVRDSIPVLGITAVAALVAAALLVVACAPASAQRPAVTAVTLAVIVAGAAWRTDDVFEIGRNSWTSARAVESVQGAILPAGERVRFREVPTGESPSVSWSDQRRRRMLYQLYLPHNEMVLDADLGAAELTPFVFAPLGDPVLTERGAEVLWRDPAVRMALWRDPP